MKTVRMSSKKVLALVLALMMMAALAAPALASPELVYATTSLNARSGPGTNYPIVGELLQGQQVPRVGTSGSWSIVELGNTRVYVFSSYLKVVGSGGSTGGTVRYTTGRVNVRSGPGTGYRVMATLSKGDAVSVLSTVGTWSRIKWNDGTGYVFSKYLTGSGSGNNNSGSVTPAHGTMQATTNVNVRSGPGTNYSRSGYLYRGEVVERTGIIGDWTRVTYNGKTAYVHSSYLRLVGSEPNITPASGTVEATTGVNVRTGPGSNYSVMGSLRRGDRLTRTGISGSWTRVEYNGEAGFVSSGYLRVVSGGGVTGERMYVTEYTVMRSAPGDNYSRLTEIPAGAPVTFYERSGSWGRVYYNGYTGYVRMSVLSSDQESNVYGMAYAPNGATVYSSAGGSGVMGTLPRGEGTLATGSSGSFIRVTYYGRTGYVRSSDVVVLTSNSQTTFSESEKTMYSKADNLAVYKVPSESSAYYYGWMPLNEQVQRIAYNSTWTKIYADGRILYTRTENLKDSTGGSNPGGVPGAGTILQVTRSGGAQMFTGSSMSVPYSFTSGAGLMMVRVPTGANVTFISAVGNAYQVSWSEYGQTFYINASDVQALITPYSK